MCASLDGLGPKIHEVIVTRLLCSNASNQLGPLALVKIGAARGQHFRRGGAAIVVEPRFELRCGRLARLPNGFYIIFSPKLLSVCRNKPSFRALSSAAVSGGSGGVHDME